MNASELDLREYISVFLSVLAETAEEFLPAEKPNLLHLALLPARVRCFVSTQFGIAIEFVPDSVTTIETVHGRERIEELFLGAPGWVKRMSPGIHIRGPRGVIRGEGTIQGTFPFRLTSAEATLTLDGPNFVVGNWTRRVHYAEIYGDRRAQSWTREVAMLRAKDEVLTALVELRKAAEGGVSIERYIATSKQSSVLLLGAYDALGERRLERISEALRGLNYSPILIRDVPDHPHHSIAQKVTAIAAVCRFVVIDDSQPSGHLSEIEICKSGSWVTVLLRAGGRGGSWMSAGASIQSNVIFEAGYDPESPADAVTVAAEWAEAKLVELQSAFGRTYPWRTSG